MAQENSATSESCASLSIRISLREELKQTIDRAVEAVGREPRPMREQLTSYASERR